MNEFSRKILVSTIPSWNDKTGSTTLSELLKGFPANNIANIYLRSDIPNSKVCNNYFQIVENNVLKSIFNKKIKTGRSIRIEEIDKDNHGNTELKKEKQRYNSFRKYRLWIFLFVREFIWKVGKWNSKELNDFIDKFHPDVIFFPIEASIFFNRINEYIIKKTGKKAIGFIWDDVFSYKSNPWWEIGFVIHRFFLRKSVKRLVNKCETVFSIVPKLKDELDKEYNINSILLTKPINYDNVSYYPKEITIPLKMIYTGRLLYGRDKTLIKIVEAIKVINQNGPKISLDIYTQTDLKEKVYNKLNVQDCCNINGAISPSEVADKQDEADILLFCESLYGSKKYVARLSFSTKLTEYFRQGKCIFAVGPKDIAPIEYLSDNKGALVATNQKEIINCLTKMINNKNLINEYAQHSFELGKKNHNVDDINKVLFSAF